MPVLLVRWRQEHHDLKANLGYIDTGLKKGGKNGELSQFLTATPNSADTTTTYSNSQVKASQNYSLNTNSLLKNKHLSLLYIYFMLSNIQPL